eukprot:CAMPEP_0117423888 /NCGR_PEP_ID=MMETSP0758-20121206/4413_1 /TAXON_ID=63605 /ORGANISM="Percolomonas cosmopolitus, Strain AE-1 (ATCC 50343)" /LENGTH=544 /DNA_ID=CAMNT_0005207329 /DNA_START=219 /DNA_END=1853 /DNA_ORIENTATION=-
MKEAATQLLEDDEPIQLINTRNLLILQEMANLEEQEDKQMEDLQEEEDDEEEEEEEVIKEEEDKEEEELTLEAIAGDQLPSENNIEQFIKQMNDDMEQIDDYEQNDPIHTAGLNEMYGMEEEEEEEEETALTDKEKMKEFKNWIKMNRKEHQEEYDEDQSDADSFTSDVFDQYQEILDDIEEEEEEDEDEEEEVPGFNFEQLGNQKMMMRDDDDDELDLEENMTREEAETQFEKEEYELIKQMEELEDIQVAEKAWQETGEVLASQRKKDSLIQEELDYQQGAKRAPVVTEEYSQSIEEIIIQRIMNQKFDDPIPIKTTAEQTRDTIELNSTKSKKGLADLYEEAYLEQVHGIKKNVEEDEQVAIIKMETNEQMSKLMHTLNSMSSFAYVAPPKPSEDAKKLAALRASNKAIPTTDMEEGPLLRSGAVEESQNAPQEMMKPVRHLPLGESERTKEDRKRIRNRKKRIQKKKSEATQQFVKNTMNHLNEAQTKKLAASFAEKQAATGVQSNKFTNSKDFFNKMQRELESKTDGIQRQRKQKARSC